jgi:hypothetical protein
MDSNHYDSVVIGSGPAGQKAAITAASGNESLSWIVRKRWATGTAVNRMKITTQLLAALILGGRLTITGTAFASEQVVSKQVTSESVPSDQTNQETNALGRLALALSAGNDAMRPLRGSQTGYREKDRLDPPVPDMECDVDRIASYVSCYSSAMGTREEAGNLFTRFVDELQSTLPSDRWRKVKEEPRIDSSRSYTYVDQESDAHIDIDLIALADSYMVRILGWPAIYPRL